MLLHFLALLPLALASPLFPRQNATSSNSTSPGSASGPGSPSVTIIPEGTGGQGVTITGTNYAAFGQDVYTGIPFAAPRKYPSPPHLDHAAEDIPRVFGSDAPRRTRSTC